MGITRRTKSVDLLLNEFKKEAGAISTITLIDRLSSKINKSTIYRVLEKLEDDDLLYSFMGRKGVKWYAKCTSGTTNDHHPHFQCLECGKVDSLSVEISIPRIKKREVSVSQILIQGKCEDCIEQ